MFSLVAMRPIRLLPAILLAMLLTGPIVLAQAPGQPRQTPDGWETLIGTSLSDSFNGSLTDWRIDDGVLIGTADGTLTANRFIISKAPAVADFEMEVDVWISRQGNSGLQYRSESREDLGPAVMTGYQCDVVSNNPNYNGMLYEERARRIMCHTGQKVVTDSSGQGWVVDSWPAPKFEPEQWHRYRIEVIGNVHRHWIDDTLTIEHVDLDQSNRSLKGLIGVQVHVGPPMEVRYRNFFIKRLTPIASPTTDFPIPADAEKIVPQGGWKAAGQRDSNARLVAETLPQTGRAFRAGSIWLTSTPSSAAIEQIADSGVSRVIALQPETETWSKHSATMQAANLPQPIRLGGPSQTNAAEELTPEDIDAAREVLRSARPGKGVWLVCDSGNRAGAIWLAHRVLDGRQALPLAIAEAHRVGLVDPELEKMAIQYASKK